MAKNLQLMQLAAMVPLTKVIDVEKALKAAGAGQVMWRPYLNGHDEGPAPGNAERGASQQEWLRKHTSGTFAARDLTEGWTKAGFHRSSIHWALFRACKEKLLKKLATGKYRRIG